MKLFKNINVRKFSNTARDLRELDVYVDRLIARRKRVAIMRNLRGETIVHAR